MSARVVVLAGDGIGPEVTKWAQRALECAANKFGFEIEFVDALIGGAALDATGEPLPEASLKACLDADAVLLGAVGGPKWDNREITPVHGLLRLRKELKLFANLRPATCYPSLMHASPLKGELLKEGLDILIVRELTGGIYFGERGRYLNEAGDETAYDTETYSRSEIRRIARAGFDAARTRGGRLTSVDKQNVLETSRMWRDEVEAVARQYPDVELKHLYVDNAAMQLVINPTQFDVIVASNMFGDILSDIAAVLTGSIGMLPSASLAEGRFGLYEPVHGSAPTIAGQGKANPLAAILSGAMLLRYSLGQEDAAASVERAVSAVLEDGLRTSDLGGSATTDEMGEAVLRRLG